MKELYQSQDPFEKKDYIPSWGPAVACDVASKLLGKKVNAGTTTLHYAESLTWSKGDEFHREFEEKLYQDLVQLNRVLKWDFIRMPGRLTEKPIKQIDKFTFVYGSESNPTIRKYDPASGNFAAIKGPQDNLTVDDIPKIVKEERKNFKKDVHLVDYYSNLIENFRKAGADGFELIVSAAGICIPPDNIWLPATLLYPEAIEEYLDLALERALYELEILNKLGVRYIAGGGDLASNKGPMYSPDCFKKMMTPRLKKIGDFCKENNMVYSFRSDGNLWSILDEILIKAGCQAYGEIDKNAGMEIDLLKERYPEKIFFGNIPSALLHNANPERVIKETKELIEKAKGAKLVLGPSNAILKGTPVENVLAMVETLEKYREDVHN